MRPVLAIAFAALFIGSLACGIVLGGPPSTVFRAADFLIVFAEGLLFLASMLLIGLLVGIGSEGKKSSTWRLPLLCLPATLLCFIFGLAIFSSKMEDLTPQHAALNVRLKIYAGSMIL